MRAEARRYPGREQEAMEQMRADPNFVSSLHGPMLEEKVFRLIEKTAKVKRRSVGLEALNHALSETESHPEAEG